VSRGERREIPTEARAEEYRPGLEQRRDDVEHPRDRLVREVRGELRDGQLGAGVLEPRAEELRLRAAGARREAVQVDERAQ
jgi:hypothetical protein